MKLQSVIKTQHHLACGVVLVLMTSCEKKNNPPTWNWPIGTPTAEATLSANALPEASSTQTATSTSLQTNTETGSVSFPSTQTSTLAATPSVFPTVKKPNFDGTVVNGSPLPELDGTWILKEIDCVSGALVDQTKNIILKDVQTGKSARRLTFLGSSAIREIRKSINAENYCIAKSSAVLTYFPSEVEIRIDKANWGSIGNATGCAGELPAETWIATLYITGDAANVLVAVVDEKNAAEQHCSSGFSKLIYQKE